jgi:L-ascorbate metabolism protein UlaG (beta-lactamase superfamily)
MKQPLQKDAQFLEDVRRTAASGQTRLWWLGQSGFLIISQGRGVLLDPYLSDSLTRKYAPTDKPHTRVTERVVAPEALADLDLVDVISSSHNHTDHLDAETLKPFLERNRQTRLVIPAANREFVLERLGPSCASRLVQLDAGRSAKLGLAELHGIAAAHNTVERDAIGRCKFLGYVVRLASKSIYHSGDTLWHDGLVPAVRPLQVDLALLPINGNRPERKVAGNLDPVEAARLAREIGATVAVPCHYDMFEFNTADPGDFVRACTEIGQDCQVLLNGEALAL